MTTAKTAQDNGTALPVTHHRGALNVPRSLMETSLPQEYRMWNVSLFPAPPATRHGPHFCGCPLTAQVPPFAGERFTSS